VNAGDTYARTALVHAITADNIEAIRKLIEHGADVNFLDKQGAPPLSYLKSPLTETRSQIHCHPAKTC
jgi:ankyrin repeat protein